MKIEVIVSTMNLEDVISKVKQMNLFGIENLYVTIINQVKEGFSFTSEVENLTNNIKVIYTTQIGIGISRNLGLKYINKDSDIVCFTDDDVVYSDDFYTIINKLYLDNTNLEVAVYNVTSLNKNRQIQKIHFKHRVNSTNIFRYALYNLAIKKEILLRFKNINFSNKFGGNSKYLCGEDTLFIYNMYKNKVKFIAFPLDNIAYVDHNTTTWHDKEFSKEYFVSKGALFYACDKKMYYLYILYFALKHSFKCSTSFANILKLMISGKNKYIEEDEEFEDYIMEC